MAIKSNSLLPSTRLDSTLDEQGDPMTSMGNLMDLMLVFALGILIMLVSHFGVELSQQNSTMPEIERLDAELEQVYESIQEGEAQFTELGTTYQDIDTGEIYIVAPADSESEPLIIEEDLE